jgi:hypothetical protein
MTDTEAITVKLAELLKHPDDLDKIPALQSEFTRKKAAIDSQLRIGLQEQLSVTQSGVSAISQGQRTVDLIKAELMKIDKLCAEAQNMVKDFPDVGKVAVTHRNFAAVEKMKSDVEDFDIRLAECDRLLRQDDEDMENQPNLLAIHYEISRLRDIKDSALEQVRLSEAGEELINNLALPTGVTLQDYFVKLQETVEWFDDHVGTACMQLIPLIHSGNNGLVVRLALVIEEEEKNDKKARALQDAQQEYKEIASRFKSITSGKKEIRGYKEKFLKAIELNCTQQMEESDQQFQEDPDKLEKSVRWYFNDLNTVKLGMVSLMPKKWKIFQTYVNIYHRAMHDWLISRIEDAELKPPQLLAILNWVEKYYSKMKKLGISEGQLQPPLIDDRSADLVREYRQLIIKSVDDWMSRMSSTDTSTFKNRDENGLDIDENGHFRTKTLSDMWRMLREQLQVAGSSERNDIAEGVVDAMFRTLQGRQRMWEKLVDEESQRYSSPTANQDGYAPLQDWLIAIANDQIACIDDADESEGAMSYLSRFSRDIQQLVSPEYIATASAQLDTLRDGYIDLSTYCLSAFASLIFTVDFRSLLPEFFTQAWYGKKGMGQAISTFDDYLKDYLPALHPTLRDILAEALADELLVRYLSCVRNRGAKFRRSDPFVDKIKDDVLTVFGFFERFDTFESIKQKWRVVEGFVNLLEVEKAGVPDMYERFKQEYSDAGMNWVETVLKSRDDFDRNLLNAVKARAGSMDVQRGGETIMSKVK